MPNIVYNFFGKDACEAGMKLAFANMLPETPLTPINPQSSIVQTPIDPVPQAIEYSAAPFDLVQDQTADFQSNLIPCSSRPSIVVRRPASRALPQDQHKPNYSSLSHPQSEESPSLGFLTASDFNTCLTDFLDAGNADFIDEFIANCTRIELDSFNPHFQFLQSSQEPDYDKSANALHLLHQHMQAPGKLGSGTCTFKKNASGWVMSIRQHYLVHLKKHIKLSNLVCIFMHDVCNGYDCTENCFQKIHKSMGYSTNSVNDPCVLTDNYSAGTEIRFRFIYVIDNYMDRNDMMSRLLRMPKIKNFNALSLLTYVDFLACCVGFEAHLCIYCAALTQTKHHHNLLLSKKEEYCDILFYISTGFIEPTFKSIILPQHAKYHPIETIYQVASRMQHLFEYDSKKADEMFNCRLNFLFESGFDNVHEQKFYETKLSNVYDRCSLNYMSLVSRTPPIPACGCKKKYLSIHDAQSHFCRCFGFKSISGSYLIALLTKT